MVLGSIRSVWVCMLYALVLDTYAQQGLNNLWLGGFDSDGPPPFGGLDLDLQSGSMAITTVSRAIGYRRTSANITDANGELLFSTNGAFIANATGDTLLNGTGLNPSTYTSNYPEGLYIPQACLILPKPGSATIYYLVHSTVDLQVPNYFATQLYLTVVDMSMEGGLGAVVLKNEILLSDSLVGGKLTAVRHANGRDWWVLCHKKATNIFFRLLVTPGGISTPQPQAIGVVRNYSGGQVCFSPQGDKFAYYWGMAGEDLEIFDFDRCTGLLSDPVHILINDANNHGGVAFSPSGRYLYVSSIEDVYQYDTEAPDIATSMVHIAEWDGFYSPNPPLATLFDIAQLAPDGKIYIGTGNSTDVLHVIHDPDEAGATCNMEQHGISLPRYFENSLPNHPNYHLGPVDGSVCDSLGMGVAELQAPLAAATVSPNPSAGSVNLSYGAQREAGEVQVLDAQGRVVLRERLPAWSTVHAVELVGEPAGMYHCRLQWGGRATSVRVIVQP